MQSHSCHFLGMNLTLSLPRQAVAAPPSNLVCFGGFVLQSACRCGAESDKARQMAAKSWEKIYNL